MAATILTELKKCAYCKDPFVPARADVECCCKECSKAWYNMKANKAYREQRLRDKEQLESMRPRKRGKPKQSVAEIAVAARAAGMTYGQYVAKMEYDMAVKRSRAWED